MVGDVLNFAASSEQPWEWGWDAVAAIGTAFAALVALMIWGLDRWGASRRRKNQAKLLAVILAPKFNSIRREVEKLVSVMDEQAEQGYCGFFNNAAFRKRVCDAIDSFDLNKFPSGLEGFSPLSLGMSALVVDAITCIAALKNASFHFASMKEDASDERVVRRAKRLRTRLKVAQHKVGRAWRICVKMRPEYKIIKNMDRVSVLNRIADKIRRVFYAAWKAAME